jgi:hypothetical protein
LWQGVLPKRVNYELTCVTTMISRWRPRSTFWTGLAHTGD